MKPSLVVRQVAKVLGFGANRRWQCDYFCNQTVGARWMLALSAEMIRKPGNARLEYEQREGRKKNNPGLVAQQ